VAAGDPALATLHAEPGLALTPGPTGLEALAAIAAGAAAHLTDGGWLILEHGSSQAAQVSAMLARAGFEHIGSHADHGGHPRVTQGAVSFHPSPQEHP
jgi:release factor glutamine methyltransferase